MTDDWVTVIPARDEVKKTAQLLILLARSPFDVRTARGGNEFRIPPYLADLYHAEATPAPRRSRRAKTEESDE